MGFAGHRRERAWKYRNNNDFGAARSIGRSTTTIQLSCWLFRQRPIRLPIRLPDGGGDFSAQTGARRRRVRWRNWSATYIGHFGENFVAKAMYGINRVKQPSLATAALGMEAATPSPIPPKGALRRPGMVVGHPGNSSHTRDDAGEAAHRFEWTWQPSAALRRGPGNDGPQDRSTRRYRLATCSTSSTPAGRTAQQRHCAAGVFAVVDARRFATGSPERSDRRRRPSVRRRQLGVTPNFMLNLGLAPTKFHNKLRRPSDVLPRPTSSLT